MSKVRKSISPGPIWMFAFLLVTVLLVVSIIVYGLDLKIEQKGVRKALTSQVKNSGKTSYFYRINDKFAFYVFTDREPGSYDVGVTTYTRNVIPFCLTCGWYIGDSDDDRSIIQPHRIEDLVYSTKALKEDYMGLPGGAFATLNLKTGAFAHVMNLNQIAPDAADEKYRVDRKYVSSNFNEISFAGSDDEDCFISFGGVFLAYSILLVWALIAVPIKLIRNIKNSNKTRKRSF